MRIHIHTPTPDLAASIDFYERLGFHSQSRSKPAPGEDPSSVLMGGDGVTIEINPTRSARAGLRLIRPQWDDVVERLRTVAPVATVPDGHVAVDPSGVWVYLTAGPERSEVEGADEAPSPASKLGGFAGMSLETADLRRSAAFWAELGWKLPDALPENEADQPGWVGSEGPANVGINWMKPNLCPHLFFNPSLTYFNSGKNPAVIQGLREAGVPFTEEITVFNDAGEVDNVIVRDPGGYGFFVFND